MEYQHNKYPEQSKSISVDNSPERHYNIPPRTGQKPSHVPSFIGCEGPRVPVKLKENSKSNGEDVVNHMDYSGAIEDYHGVDYSNNHPDVEGDKVDTSGGNMFVSDQSTAMGPASLSRMVELNLDPTSESSTDVENFTDVIDQRDSEDEEGEYDNSSTSLEHSLGG